MNDKMIEKMITNRGKKVRPFHEAYEPEPGVIFLPPRQTEDWKSSYLIIEDVEDFYMCVRLSVREPAAAGIYDMIIEDMIIETWNALSIPKVMQIKGYRQISDKVTEAVLRVRRAWWDDELPDVSYPVGGDIFEVPDRLLFYESELQANEHLQRNLIEGTESLSRVKLWTRIGHKVGLTDYFEELQPIYLHGNLSAYIHHRYLFFLWEAHHKTPPPEASVRETGSGLFEILSWKELKKENIWEALVTIPEGVGSAVLKIGETECFLELLPSEDEPVSADSP